MINKDEKSTFDELLNRDGSVSMDHQDIQKAGIEIFKFVKVLRPEILNEIFQLREEYYYQLRSRASLHVPLVSAVFNSAESIKFLGPKTWEIIPY